MKTKSILFVLLLLIIAYIIYWTFLDGLSLFKIIVYYSATYVIIGILQFAWTLIYEMFDKNDRR